MPHSSKERRREYQKAYQARPETTAKLCVRINRLKYRAKAVGTPWAEGEPLKAIEALDAMVARYGEAACWCCGIVCKPHADHDHATGLFRAWLCPGCNTAEGNLKTVTRARMMVAFMEANQK